MKKASLLLAVILAVALGAALYTYDRWKPSPAGDASSPAPDQVPSVAGGEKAPPFSLPDLSGETFDSAKLAGRPAAINFFATWCPPCRQEIPGFVEVYEKYREQGFLLVGIALDTDTRQQLPQFVRERKISYPVLLGDLPTARAYGGVNSIPTTFFIGKDGTIRNVHVGLLTREAFEVEVRKLF